MKPAAFHYERPTSLSDVLALLAQHPGSAKILAGGQSLVPMMNFRLAKPERLIDINRLAGLGYIRGEGDAIVIGALARHADVKASKFVAEMCPLMHAAYEWVAHDAVRNRGTLCGNLCHADPASEMPAVMLATEATMVARSAGGERRIAAADFFRGPYETALRPDEMLVEVRVPANKAGQTHGFAEVSMRKGDFAWASVAALVTVRGGLIEAVALAAAGIGNKAERLSAAERGLIGMRPDTALFASIARIAAQSISPTGDASISPEYRRDLIQALVARTLADATLA